MNAKHLVLSAWLLALGCDDRRGVDAGAALDAGAPRDASATDAGPRDGGGIDAAPRDAAALDAAALDAAALDAASVDARVSLPDAGPNDGGAAVLIDANGATGDTCAAVIDLTDGGSHAGSTMDATDDYSVSGTGCPSGGAASGRDVAYVLSPATLRHYTARVVPVGTFDPMLYATDDCTFPGDCLAGTILNGVGEPEEIDFDVAAGATAFVVVDGELVSRGAYTITITFTE